MVNVKVNLKVALILLMEYYYDYSFLNPIKFYKNIISDNESGGRTFMSA